ncbi:MAG: hypothetical protein HKM04_06550 [Legionellales bacterium]|nr:hypothetical protein [Legionellales bacterium]
MPKLRAEKIIMPTTHFANIHADYSKKAKPSNLAKGYTFFENPTKWVSKKLKDHSEETDRIDAAMEKHLKKYPHEQNSLNIAHLKIEATNTMGRGYGVTAVQSTAIAPTLFSNPHSDSRARSYQITNDVAHKNSFTLK